MEGREAAAAVVTNQERREADAAPEPPEPPGVTPAPLVARPDRRGKHRNRPHAISREKVNQVRGHIHMFPKYISHYRRNSAPQRQYIVGVSSLSALYREYVSRCEEESVQPVKEKFYRKIFNEQFNISFRVPLQDTCSICDSARFREVGTPVAPEVELHQRQAEAAQDQFKADKEAAKLEDGPAVITMDLQQALPTPKIPTNKVFYCRQLWTYNFGVHLCDDNTATMCVWPEHVGSRGADEIGSCLLRSLRLTVRDGKKNLVVWSDCCSGQNKNFKIFCLWLYLVQSGQFDEIVHKFFVPGHSFMDSDRDFGLIEQKQRGEQYIFTHEGWVDLIKRTRVKKPFQVIEMTASDMLDLTPIERMFVKRKKLENGAPLSLRKLSMVRVSKDRPGVLEVMYNYNAAVGIWSSIDLRPRGIRIPVAPRLTDLRPKYPHGHRVKAPKKKDLMGLLKYIPPVHHEYFQRILDDGEEGEGNNDPDESEYLVDGDLRTEDW